MVMLSTYSRTDLLFNSQMVGMWRLQIVPKIGFVRREEVVEN